MISAVVSAIPGTVSRRSPYCSPGGAVGEVWARNGAGAEKLKSVNASANALASVQGLPIRGNTTYTFAITVPSDARLRFRPLLHPAAERCWHEGPSLRVVLHRSGIDVELWSSTLRPEIFLRLRLWTQAFLSRVVLWWSPRSLLWR